MTYKGYFVKDTVIRLSEGSFGRKFIARAYYKDTESKWILRLGERIGYKMAKGIYCIFDPKTLEIGHFSKSFKECETKIGG